MQYEAGGHREVRGRSISRISSVATAMRCERRWQRLAPRAHKLQYPSCMRLLHESSNSTRLDSKSSEKSNSSDAIFSPAPLPDQSLTSLSTAFFFFFAGIPFSSLWESSFITQPSEKEMFHQVITDLKTSVNNSGRDEKKRKKKRMSSTGGGVGGSSGGGECSHESNLSYRPFSETPDIFKALPTSNFYYSYQGEDDSIKSIGVLQFNLQEAINPLAAAAASARIQSCLQSDPCSSTAADVTMGHFSRLSTLSVCPENISDLAPSPSLFPPDMPPLARDPHAFHFASVAPGPEYSAVDFGARLTCEDEEMWNQFQGSVASSLRKKYLTRTSENEDCRAERSGSRSKKRLSLLISRMIPSRRVFGSVYCQPLSSEYEPPVTDPTILNKDCPSSSSQKRPDSSRRCSTSRLVTVFLVLLLLFASLTFGKILRIDNLWKSYPDDGSAHFAELKDSWWREAIFYEIFPASFRDSDSDGFGDLNGIREKVPYIKDLGVTGIRLNSFFTAMDYPYQYDHVTDFKSVDPHVGSLSDFKALVRLMHQHRLTVVIDINPCITSDQHHWATQWLSNKSSAYSSFYVINAENVCQTCPLFDPSPL